MRLKNRSFRNLLPIGVFVKFLMTATKLHISADIIIQVPGGGTYGGSSGGSDRGPNNNGG